jgi:hypothetical protein
LGKRDGYDEASAMTRGAPMTRPESDKTAPHLDDVINLDASPSGDGCADCESATPPGWWLHLRRCATCGHIGCCDSSPGQHASGHYRNTGHPVIQTYEPDEAWFYDYPTRKLFLGPVLQEPTSRPAAQGSPGPSGRVPDDWRRRLH